MSFRGPVYSLSFDPATWEACPRSATVLVDGLYVGSDTVTPSLAPGPPLLRR
jgi:hypothetical protein